MHSNINKSKESEMAFIQANITRVATADEDFIAEIAFKHVSLNFDKKITDDKEYDCRDAKF